MEESKLCEFLIFVIYFRATSDMEEEPLGVGSNLAETRAVETKERECTDKKRDGETDLEVSNSKLHIFLILPHNNRKGNSIS